jgi:hypothetical protein
VLKSFGNAAITELLAAVISSMHNDLHLCPAPENFLVRGPESLSQKANCMERIVIVGASNMLQTVCHLRNLGWNTVDCTVKGWIASSYGITQLSHMLKGQDLSEKPVMVIDLLSNFVHQYTVPRQCDDTLSLPYRANGKYHLAGDVTVVNDATFKKTVDMLIPIINACPDFIKIVVPPPPPSKVRYRRCCADPSHVSNLEHPNHRQAFLSAIMRLKNLLKKQLVTAGIPNCWILDCCVMAGDVDTKMWTNVSLP